MKERCYCGKGIDQYEICTLNKGLCPYKSVRGMPGQPEVSKALNPNRVKNHFPTDSKQRKDRPICTGVLDYFPDALAEVALASMCGNEKHSPGKPLQWARNKSTDHADCLIRHLADRGMLDHDGVRHSAKVAWRALALLQEEIEGENGTRC
jgi:hypothetical protein